MNEAVSQIRRAIQGAGLTPPNVMEPDGKLHRFPRREKPRGDSGRCVLDEGEIPAGAFDDCHASVSEIWPVDGVAALNAARIAGNFDEEFGTLVVKLKAARKALA